MASAQTAYENSFKLLLDSASDVYTVQSVFRDMQSVLLSGEMIYSDRMAGFISEYACDANDTFTTAHIASFVASLAVGPVENGRMAFETLSRIVSGTRNPDIAAGAIHAATGLCRRVPEALDVKTTAKFREGIQHRGRIKNLKDLFSYFVEGDKGHETVQKAMDGLQEAATKALLKRPGVYTPPEKSIKP